MPPGRPPHRYLSAFLTMGLPTLALGVCIGWVGQAINGDVLFSAWLNRLWGVSRFSPFWWWLGFLAVSACTLGLGWWLFHRLPERLPVRMLSREPNPEAHRLLILLISPSNLDFKIAANETGGRRLNFQKRDGGEAAFDVSDSMSDDIQKLTDLKLLWNWQQILRAVAPHRNRLQRIVLVGSAGDKGSHHQLEICKNLLELYCNAAEIRIDTAPTDFEDVDALYRLVSNELKTAEAEGFAQHDIMIDATGGLKTTSIAAALVTLHNRVKFQYVNNDGRVLAYEMFFEWHSQLAP